MDWMLGKPFSKLAKLGLLHKSEDQERDKIPKLAECSGQILKTEKRHLLSG